jgi:hypothetical protein
MAQTAANPMVRKNGRPEWPVLRSVRHQETPSLAPRDEVVAEILSDGSIRPMANAAAETTAKGWAEGSLSGPSWILWWTRRSFNQA